MNIFSKIWNKYLYGKKDAWADIQHKDGKTSVIEYNKKYVDKLRVELGELSENLNDRDTVKLYNDRENIKFEDPKLEVEHMGIDTDGRIKMMLNWNKAFIKHLEDNGIQAETEDQAIHLYLSLLTHQTAEDVTTDMLSKESVDAAFYDLDIELRNELEEAARQVNDRAQNIKRSKIKPKPKTTKKASSVS